MKSLDRIGGLSVSLPLSADDFLEFHAARLLWLVNITGVKNRVDGLTRIDGLTKMAKLDFFTRYPDFFVAARAEVYQEVSEDEFGPDLSRSQVAVEAAMVRHHYGPWDKRYYHVLSYLEAKHLITVSKNGKAYCITLTKGGQDQAEKIAKLSSFMPIVENMRMVKKTFGGKSGTALKKLIYRLFEAEVGNRRLGEEIRR